jgi:hypothetical protein
MLLIVIPPPLLITEATKYSAAVGPHVWFPPNIATWFSDEHEPNPESRAKFEVTYETVRKNGKERQFFRLQLMGGKHLKFMKENVYLYASLNGYLKYDRRQKAGMMNHDSFQQWTAEEASSEADLSYVPYGPYHLTCELLGTGGVSMSVSPEDVVGEKVDSISGKKDKYYVRTTPPGSRLATPSLFEIHPVTPEGSDERPLSSVQGKKKSTHRLLPVLKDP